MSLSPDLEDDVDARILATARGVIEREAHALAGVPAQIGPDFVRIVRSVLDLSGKVVTTGTGTSGIMAERLAHLLAVSGTPAFYLPCLDALHGGMGAITTSDYVIAFSKGGRSDELIQLTARLVDRGVHVLAVTERAESPFARAASETALLRTDPVDADPGGLIAMGSTLVVGAWGDALAATLMRLREHSWKDVVDIHPGGYVGGQTTLPADEGLDA
ncbi:SIS domain-containing protein [Microbacterium hydrothermale]|uniref:SIS domain-containing protein n=2 Tax=Actinomycetes TaxID=1760 RepID=UPI001F10247C|nr:SIS domain-containing protein [Microbacterium hydrothermale]